MNTKITDDEYRAKLAAMSKQELSNHRSYIVQAVMPSARHSVMRLARIRRRLKLIDEQLIARMRAERQKL